MKLLKISMVLVLVSLFAACVDDDPTECQQFDWVGTYEGISACDGDTLSASLTITSSHSNRITIKYETVDSESIYDLLEPNGCSHTEDQSDGSTRFEINAAIFMDSDSIWLEEVLVDGSTTSICVVTAVKQ